MSRLQRRHALLAWLILQLLLGQQFAMAHLIGHIGHGGQQSSVAMTVVADAGDVEHGAADTLTHVCTTCLGWHGLDAALATPIKALPRAENWLAPSPGAVPPAPAFHRPLPFLSRAPPSLQS
jgi:hypothetical protein